MAAIKGRTPWAIILCRFSDVANEPQPPQFFRNLFTDPQTGGMFDYWRDVSYQVIDLTGSTVFGWFELPYTLATDQQRTRWQRITAAIDAVRDRVDLAPFYGIIVILNAQVDSGSVGIQQLTFGSTTRSYGLLVLDPGAWNATFAAHEMGHSYGLDHSFNTNSVSNDPANDSRPGAYGDPWDIMSAMQVQSFTGQFGLSGPGLNAVNHDVLGWLPAGKVLRVDMTFGQQSHQVILSALNQPDTFSTVMAEITNRGSTSTWTVEYRRRAGWDAGINSILNPDAVLVHENRRGLSYLMTDTNGSTALGVGTGVFEGPGFSVGVADVDSARGLAIVNIMTRREATRAPVRPCDLLRSAIVAQTRVVSDLFRSLRQARSQDEIDELTARLDVELVQLDGLYEDARAFGCEGLPPRRFR